MHVPPPAAPVCADVQMCTIRCDAASWFGFFSRPPRSSFGCKHLCGTHTPHITRHHNVAQKEWRHRPGYAWPSEPYTLENDPEWKYKDALLTSKGEGQAEALQARTAALQPEVLVVSVRGWCGMGV
jgi:hypothetical protein